MARNWIKLDKTTPDKPEIIQLARALKVSQAQAFLEFVRAYIWADDVVSGEGFVANVSLSESDTLARCTPGTFAALSAEGIKWVEAVDGGVRFTRWSRHNGQDAKAGALASERKPKGNHDEYSRGFLEFWKVYPPRRKTKKPDAWRAWQRAITRASPSLIIRAAREFAASPAGRSVFCPGPGPWLNQDRWDDDRESWQQSDDDTHRGPHSPVEAPYPQFTGSGGRG